MRSRSQEMVRALTGDDAKARIEALGRSRAKNLPALLQRHGLLQVVAFLKMKAKGGESADGNLVDLLERTMRAIEPTATLAQDELAKAPTSRYLYLHELALDAAEWLARLAP